MANAEMLLAIMPQNKAFRCGDSGPAPKLNQSDQLVMAVLV
jgi:hypothetical protein